MDDRSPPEPDDLAEDLIHLVKPELQPGERLLWSSRVGARSPSATPESSPWLWAWFLGLAAICVGCCAGIPLLAGIGKEGPDALLLVIGLVSGVICFLFIVGSIGNVLSARAERRKVAGQVYALTDRRALIWVPAKGSAVSIHAFPRGTIRGNALWRVQYPDGTGDVLFRRPHQHPSGFLGIADVRRVEELVRRFLVEPIREAEAVEESHLD